MERSLKTERLYNLGDYSNITFSDEISSIPERVTLNPELMGELQYLQMIGFELSLRKYKELMVLAKTYDVEVILKFLEEERNETLDKIKSILTEDYIAHPSKTE
jgi:hypothetical protein